MQLNLDILARGPMWDMNLDYKCGTAHQTARFRSARADPRKTAAV